MWGTSQGDRTLIRHESALVRKSVGYLRDMITASIDLNERFETEVGLFDELQPTQQLAVLHEVAFALLDPDVEISELTATREATVYAIYCELNSLIEIEIEIARRHQGAILPEIIRQWQKDGLQLEDCESSTWLDEIPAGFQTRALVLAACHQASGQANEWGSDFEQDEAWPPINCEQPKLWQEAIEFLANQILWDRDFELESIFADHDPEKIADIKAYLGITDDYFSTPAPDAYSEEYQRIDRELVSLTQAENK